MEFKDMLSRFGTPMTVEQGQYLFRQGDHDKHFYLIQSGLLKAFYISEDGKEHIKSFLAKGDVIGSLQALAKGGECSFNLISLEPSDLVKIAFSEVSDAAKQDVDLANLIANFMIAFGMKKEKREYELLCLSAEERYRKLAMSNPEPLSRVNQSDIALYLGVTPVGLSRIKKRVGNKLLR